MSANQPDLSHSEDTSVSCHDSCMLVVDLSADEIASVTSVEPLYLLVPRISYLPAFYDEISDNFCDFVSTASRKEGYVHVFISSASLAM